MTKRSKPLISVFLALFLAAALTPVSPFPALADAEEETSPADSVAADDSIADSTAPNETEGAETTPPQTLATMPIF